MQELIQIVDDTIKTLTALKRSGITRVAVSRETLEELAKPPALPIVLLELQTKRCRRCPELARARQNVVFGAGNPRAELMFIGEAPGADEDAQGEPFVGKAGQLLTRIIEAMGMRRSEVYIANVLKCRPPENRTPLPDEIANCLPYLRQQIELIRPKVIVALGATALRALLGLNVSVTKMRGKWYVYEGIPIMATFHPAYLLRNEAAKRDVWQDMKAVLAKLGRSVPRKT
ncbi:MAG: uracil-DNA glycosylase [Verrucomicrobiae bacterium]|nr:uracil-DNA glycosylase [Verrucomicrobiae bacterium]